MAYQVLARKYRSQRFEEVVGQQAIATTLANAIKTDRVAHGYLFSGTRGVGKTSMARILAKALNCLAADGPTAAPCCECDSCRRVAEGDDVDVIEIDAASNTGVDNIRELRSNAAYRPARSRFKIYIIDEVHMLSTGAFNALLKTLEEPPDHVKFILATTELQKVPATIQSRCQCFEFRTISLDDIAGQLGAICKQEKVKADPGALRRVARLANGSMRDGLSLLDQLLGIEGGRLTDAMVDELLPRPMQQAYQDLVDRLADHDAAGALAQLDASLAAGCDLEQFCAGLTEHFRDLMVLRACGDSTDLIDASDQQRGQLAGQAQRFELPSYVYVITVLEQLRWSVRSGSAGRAMVEAALVRLAEVTAFSEIGTLMAQLGGSRPRAAAPASQPTESPRRSAPATAAPARPHAAAGGEARGGAEPAPSRAAAAAPPPKPVNRQDLAEGMAEPMVRKAVDLFNATLQDVRRQSRAARLAQPDTQTE